MCTHCASEQIKGIEEWGLMQAVDLGAFGDGSGSYLGYQGLIISSFAVSDDGSTETIEADTDYYQEIDNDDTFYVLKRCPSFRLVDGDYINGFDLYYSRFTIFGLTFYSHNGYKYPCPGDEV